MTDTATDLKADSRALDLSASAPSDANLYRRGLATLLAAWERYAHASEGAAVHRLAGAAAAVFPTEPERSVYNNAVLKCALTASRREEVIAAMEAAYANGRDPLCRLGTRDRPAAALRSRTAGLYARRGDARDGNRAR